MILEQACFTINKKIRNEERMDKLYKIRKKVFNYIESNNMISEDDTVVIGVSGGADSMCMLNVLMEYRKELRYEIIVVHIHHGIRGKDADEDMEYVKDFCKKHNISFVAKKYDVPRIAKEEKLSEEEAGRKLRYNTFEEILNQNNVAGGRGKIAIAHNMDDSVETFLHNLFRGAGIKGLGGIQAVRDNIIRPILCLQRAQIEEYLGLIGVSYRTDKTNYEDDYTRNKIRLNILPYIKENINDGVKENISRASLSMSEINTYLEKQADKAFFRYAKNIQIEEDKNINIKKEYYIIDEKLWDEDGVIIKLVIRKILEAVANKLKDITSRHVESVYGLGKKEVSKSVSLPYGIRAVRTYDGVEVYKNEKTDRMEEVSKNADKEVTFSLEKVIQSKENVYFANGIIRIDVEKNKDIDLTENLYTKFMDYDILEGNLTFRKRKAGDYMIIDKSGRRKKLKDLLIDLKIPREKRDDLLLLAKDSEVLWIIGVRMGESCKIRMNTNKIVRIQFDEMEN